MKDEILTYLEMCARERLSLQRGMNFRSAPGISIVLMSRRPSAPYNDSLSNDGTELIYEGHDANRAPGVEPKTIDQPLFLPSGQPTENGKFVRAIEAAGAPTPLVRVYEKLRDGIWSDRGLFDLTRYEYVSVNGRKVFRFHMVLSDQPDEPMYPLSAVADRERDRRIIPSWVKQEVFKRDKGQCVICGKQSELHFDHDFPFSKGGTGLTPANVRVLCARHNLAKSARIE